MHLKILRAYVESLLRYGLPAAYFYCFVKVRFLIFVHCLMGLICFGQPDPRQAKKLLSTLTAHFKAFTPALKDASKNKKDSGAGADDAAFGEYHGILEQEMFDFVLFEVPIVTAEEA